MMTTEHETYRENLAAYALEALEYPEIEPLEAHLRTCDACKADLEAYRHIQTGLLFAVPPKRPSSSLRRSLQRRLTAAGRPVRRGFQLSWNQALMAGAFVLLIGLGLGSIAQVRQLQQQQAEFEDENRSTQTLVSMLAYPNTQAVRFAQNEISGSVLVDKDRGLLGLFVWHLPPSQAGKTYQVWLIDASGDRTSGGFLVPEAGYAFVTTVIQVPGSLADFKGLGVTAEPLGGSPAPTGPRIFGVDF
jgi:anti-sigma-K factor RskA